MAMRTVNDQTRSYCQEWHLAFWGSWLTRNSEGGGLVLWRALSSEAQLAL